ncbi:MAG: ATP-binding cassette domain-containing protein [Oscillospiraceae bacterium]|jgi:oligopeptide transport system ATP-binding protein|nr:ATP-binding cassette domain-containing protein [Oscillospiraceae bacterium]
MNQTAILEVKNLKQYFPVSKHLTVKAVDDISFQIRKGEIFGLVGESGSGKSTVARSIMGLYQLTDGEVWFQGNKISDPKVFRSNRRDIQKNMQIIFQDSAAALNPRMTVRNIIAEPMQACRMFVKNKEAMDAKIDKLLDQVGLAKSFRSRYPGELSGGQRQRVAIARSIGTNPDIIIADEPIASLDVSIQAQILTLFQNLQQEYGFAFLFIAHDLSVVRFLSNTVGVMLHGKILEMAETEELFQNPLHPYTKALLSAVPVADPIYERSKKILYYDPSKLSLTGSLQQLSPKHWMFCSPK